MSAPRKPVATQASMKVGIIGGGPGGLFAALLLKQRDPSRKVCVFERRPSPQGWGVVFSQETLDELRCADPSSFERMHQAMVQWSAIDTTFRDQCIRCEGHHFCAIERKRMLSILAKRCDALGVEVHRGKSIDDPVAFAKHHDLVIAADGIHSSTRDFFSSQFEPTLIKGRNPYIWLGFEGRLDSFCFYTRENKDGLFQAHAYPFSATHSAFIVECEPATFARAGLESLSVARTLAYLQTLFAPDLQGATLLAQQSRWSVFERVNNQRWHHQNIVLLGDAAHSAHFSIGSGTKLAMEDAIALADAMQGLKASVSRHALTERLEQYQAARWVPVAKLQKSATTSRRWFEGLSRYRALDPLTFCAHLLTRSKQITHGNLKLRDPDFVKRWDQSFAQSAGLRRSEPALPPMFTPFRVGGLTLKNRVVVSPMCQYSADEGIPGDWHLAHLGALARGGAGLVIAEMTAIAPEARITPKCTGLYNQAQEEAWASILKSIRSIRDSRFGIQLGHAGRKGSCTVPWKGDRALTAGGWPTVAPSPLAYDETKTTPQALDPDQIPELLEAYTRAAQRADRAGFDLVEIHMAHGYLLGSFLSPLTNQRTDAFGGSLQGRAKLPLLVLDAVRAVWPARKALSVRISATDWAPGGLSFDDCLSLARMLKAGGCDILDVSTGQTVAHQAPEYGRMFQTPFSDAIRQQVGIPTITVGAISSWDQVNTIIGTQRADLCALGRPHLLDPHFTLRAAQEQGVKLDDWPAPYLAVAPREPGS